MPVTPDVLRGRAPGLSSPPPVQPQETLLNTDIRALTERVQAGEQPSSSSSTSEAGKVIVGQRYMVERVLIGLLCNGHVLLEGVPGPRQDAHRADASPTRISAQFQRIQFTPGPAAGRPGRHA